MEADRLVAGRNQESYSTVADFVPVSALSASNRKLTNHSLHGNVVVILIAMF
jgi:hypothetical protein